MFAFLLIISLCHTALGQSYSQSSSDAEAETPVGCGLRNMFGVSDNNIFDENFAKFGEFPWVVAILKTSDWTKDETKKHEYLCSGSLIHPSYVLTAAHCVMPQDEGEPLQKELLVRAGEWDTSSTSEPLPHQDRTVDASIIPTEEQTMYYAGGRFYDIALLKLKEPMNLTDNVQVVCLPLEDTPVPSSANCFTTGWKRNAPADGSPNLLKKVELPLVSNQLCQSRLRTRTKLGQQFELHESFLCAGGEPGVDPCKGDGGSPLVCPIPGSTDLYMQFGIVSWNKGCGRNRVPAVFSSISKSYKWLDKLLYNMDVDFSPYDPIIEPTQPN